MRTHKDLIVWQKAMELVENVYRVSRKLPREERFGICSQIQRAAVGIPSNIAEGAKREHKLEYVQFLAIANGSSAELETQLLLIAKLYPKTSNEINLITSDIEEIQRMIYSLMKSLKR